MRTETLAAQRTRHLIVNILKYTLLLFASFIALVPLVSCVSTAFKTSEEYCAPAIHRLIQRKSQRFIHVAEQTARRQVKPISAPFYVSYARCQSSILLSNRAFTLPVSFSHAR